MFFYIQTNEDKLGTTKNGIGEIIFYRTELKHVTKNEDGIMYVDNEILLVANDAVKYTDIEKIAKKNIMRSLLVGSNKRGDYLDAAVLQKLCVL